MYSLFYFIFIYFFVFPFLKDEFEKRFPLTNEVVMDHGPKPVSLYNTCTCTLYMYMYAGIGTRP